MKNATTFLTWLVLAIAMAISGIVYGVIVFPGEPAIIGGVFAILIGVPVLAFERGIFLPRLSQRIQKLPTVPFVVAAVVAYEVIMSVGYAIAAAGLGWVFPAVSALGANSVRRHEQGSAAGSISTAHGVGMIIGPLIGTLAYGLDPGAPYALMAVLMLLVALWPKRRRPIGPADEGPGVPPG